MKVKRFKPYLISGFFFIVLLYFVVRLWFAFAIGLETKNWIQTNGVITSNSIKSVARSNRTGAYTSFFIDMKYKYYVNDILFVGSIISYKLQNNKKEALQNIQKKYFIGKKVNVYYNPSNIKQAVLKKGSDSSFAVVMTIIWSIFGCLTYYFWKRRCMKIAS